MSTNPATTRIDRLAVLLADDSAVNLTLGARILESHGHRVTTVSNGREAFEALLSDRYDLVLMDVEMPELDGLAATRMIREHEDKAGIRVPIVALTTNDNPVECLAAGMDGFLAKPLRYQSLSKTLRTIIARTAA